MSMFEIVSIIGEALPETSWEAHFHGVRKFPLRDLTDLNINCIHEFLHILEPSPPDEPLEACEQKKIRWG